MIHPLLEGENRGGDEALTIGGEKPLESVESRTPPPAFKGRDIGPRGACQSCDLGL